MPGVEFPAVFVGQRSNGLNPREGIITQVRHMYP